MLCEEISRHTKTWTLTTVYFYIRIEKPKGAEETEESTCNAEPTPRTFFWAQCKRRRRRTLFFLVSCRRVAVAHCNEIELWVSK